MSAPSTASPPALLVGAGAVGQAFALWLSRGGTPVEFLVKPHHEARLAPGMPVQELSMLGVGPVVDLSVCPRHTAVAQVSGRQWHSVWLCVPGPALTAELVAPLVAATAPAPVVVFQVGALPQDDAMHAVPNDRLIRGILPLLSWWAPLGPEDSRHEPAPLTTPRMRIWRPPFTRFAFSGAPAHEVAEALLAGSVGAQVVPDVGIQAAMGSCVLVPFIAGLRACGWSLSALRRSRLLDDVVGGVAEARAIVAPLHGHPTPPGRLPAPWLLRLILRLATTLGPRVAPLPLEAYLRVHFSKVGDQMAASLSGIAAAGDAVGRPTTALRNLERAVGSAPEPARIAP